MYSPDNSDDPGPSDIYRSGPPSTSNSSISSIAQSPSTASGSDHEKNVRIGAYLSSQEIIEIDSDSDANEKRVQSRREMKNKPAPKSVKRRRASKPTTSVSADDLLYYTSSEPEYAEPVNKRKAPPATVQISDHSSIDTDSDYNYDARAQADSDLDPVIITSDEDDQEAKTKTQERFMQRIDSQRKLAHRGFDSAGGAAPLTANPRLRQAFIDSKGRAVNADGTAFTSRKAPGKRIVSDRYDVNSHPHTRENDRDMPITSGA